MTAPEDWGSLGGSTFYGGFLTGYSETADWDQTSWYAGLTLNTPVKALKVGASYTYLGTTGAGAGADNYADALAGYVSFQATEKLSIHGRAEYVWTDSNLFGTDPAGAIVAGNSEIFAFTATLQYDLWKNVISRLEIRWDHTAGDQNMVGYGSATGLNKKNNVLIAANVIYQF